MMNRKDDDAAVRPGPPTIGERRRSLARHIGALLALELLDDRRHRAVEAAAAAPEPASGTPGSDADEASRDAGG